MTPYARHTIGRLGEDIACSFLLKKGFFLIERNYRKKWGELDIIAEKSGVLHFVEVKTVSSSISHETSSFRPEENIHPRKLKRLWRAIETYLDSRSKKEVPWQIDGVIIFLNKKKLEARVRLLQNIIE